MGLGSWKKLHRLSQKPLGELVICIGKWQAKKKTEKALLSTTGKIMLVPNLEFSLKSFHSFFYASVKTWCVSLAQDQMFADLH